MNKFRLNGIALGTYEIENNIYDYFRSLSEISFDYIDTSICYNNDYIIGNRMSYLHKKIISKIPPQMTEDYELMVSNHLRCLRVNKIDIMLIHNPRADWTELALNLINDDRFIEIGVSNFSIDDLKKYKEVTGSYPAYNEFEINPEYYDKELIDFCHDNNIKIISYAVLGGKYNARKNISYYTLNYLLSLAAYNADIVIIRSDNLVRLFNMSKVLTTINDTTYPDESLFTFPTSILNKSIIPDKYKLPKYTNLIKVKDLIIPTYDSDCSAFSRYRNTVTSIDSSLLDQSIKLSDELNKINDFVKHIKLPNYEFLTDYRVLFRYLIKDYIDRTYDKKKYYNYLYLSDPDIQIVSIYKKGFLGLYSKEILRFMIQILLYDESTKSLTKVNNGDVKIIVKLIPVIQ